MWDYGHRRCLKVARKFLIVHIKGYNLEKPQDNKRTIESVASNAEVSLEFPGNLKKLWEKAIVSSKSSCDATERSGKTESYLQSQKYHVDTI